MDDLAPAIGDERSGTGQARHAVLRDDTLGLLTAQLLPEDVELGDVGPGRQVQSSARQNHEDEVLALPDRRIRHGAAVEGLDGKVRKEVSSLEHSPTVPRT